MSSLNPIRDLPPCFSAPGILVIACLAFSSVASAQTIYKCVDSENHIAFQHTPCQSGQRASEVAIKPAPPPPPSTSGSSRQSFSPAREYTDIVPHAPEPPPARSKPVVQSWECTTVTGEIFYWHSPCPQVVEDGFTSKWDKWTVETGPHYLPVTGGKSVPRSLACRNMRAPGRSGRKYDQQTSTYDRNLGRDPCSER